MFKKLIVLVLALAMTVTLCACGGKENKKEATGINYKVLVNKLHKLPANWEKELKTTTFTNTVGDKVEVENKAYKAYLKLKEELKKDKIYVDLDSARRSVADQKRIMKDFTKQYGADYAKKTVAEPGYSEHHTGLALDLYLIIDGKDITENEDMVKYTGTWAQIHNKLAKYGFILRYLRDKEQITGYGYEPWHIRYIDDPKAAKEIMKKGETFENYLGAAKDTNPKIDLGKSKLWKKDELKEATVTIKCQFASWDGCELESITYVGDKCNTPKNIKWLNSLNKNGKYKKIAEFKMNFKTPKKGWGTLEPNKNYKDYEWWLAQNKEGDWEVVTMGY
ncbi:MAG: M15 family metallopeptidase [Eubacterium sp.]|nr:M15 family metallopeptidase [Eubacterium sp.]